MTDTELMTEQKSNDPGYMKKYLKENTRRISLNLHNENDRDILSAIQETDPNNIQGAIKDLIRKGIKYRELV